MSRSKEPYWVVRYGSDEDVAKWLSTEGHIDDLIDPVKKETAMHVAVETLHAKRVKLLLDHKPDLSIRDASGRTPVDVAAAELEYFQRTQRIGLPSARTIHRLLQAVSPNSWESRVEQERLLPLKPRQEYKDPHRPGKTEEQINGELEKNGWRARMAEQILSKQAEEAKEAGNGPLATALSQRAERAAWHERECSERLIGYEIGDPPNSDPKPKAPLRRRDFEL